MLDKIKVLLDEVSSYSIKNSEDLEQFRIQYLGKKGIINLGGPSQTVYNFAKKYNKKIKKIYSRGEFPKKIDMNLSKLKKFNK